MVFKDLRAVSLFLLQDNEPFTNNEHVCYFRAQSLSDTLNAQGWPATFISGSRDQQDRLAAMAQLKKLQCRILVSTDLVSIVRSLSNTILFITQCNQGTLSNVDKWTCMYTRP